MKISKFLAVLVLFMVMAVLMVLLGLLGKLTNFSAVDGVLISQKDKVDRMLISRKLKENGHSFHAEKGSNMGSVGLEDYHPVDPSPSSKTSVKPGPIQHGTPLMPYIPVPLPPSPSSPREGD